MRCLSSAYAIQHILHVLDERRKKEEEIMLYKSGSATAKAKWRIKAVRIFQFLPIIYDQKCPKMPVNTRENGFAFMYDLTSIRDFSNFPNGFFLSFQPFSLIWHIFAIEAPSQRSQASLKLSYKSKCRHCLNRPETRHFGRLYLRCEQFSELVDYLPSLVVARWSPGRNSLALINVACATLA